MYLQGELDEPAINAVCEKICQTIQAAVEVRHGVIDHVGASIGIARFPADGASIDSLLRVADTRMFQSKHARKSA